MKESGDGSGGETRRMNNSLAATARVMTSDSQHRNKQERRRHIMESGGT